MKPVAVIALLLSILGHVVAPNPSVKVLGDISQVNVLVKTEEEEVYKPTPIPPAKSFFKFLRKQAKTEPQQAHKITTYIVEKAIPSSSFGIVRQIDDTRGYWIVVKELPTRKAAMNSGQDGYTVQCIESFSGLQYLLTSTGETEYTMEGLIIMENVYFYEFEPEENSIPACIASKGAFIVFNETLKKNFAFIAVHEDSFYGDYTVSECSSKYGDANKNLEVVHGGEKIVLQGPYLGFGFTPQGEEV